MRAAGLACRAAGAGLERLVFRRIGGDRQLRGPPTMRRGASGGAIAVTDERHRRRSDRAHRRPYGPAERHASALSPCAAGAAVRECHVRSRRAGRRHGRACRAPLPAHPGCGRYRCSHMIDIRRLLRAQAAGIRVRPHVFDAEQKIGEAALDSFQMAEAGSRRRRASPPVGRCDPRGDRRRSSGLGACCSWSILSASDFDQRFQPRRYSAAVCARSASVSASTAMRCSRWLNASPVSREVCSILSCSDSTSLQSATALRRGLRALGQHVREHGNAVSRWLTPGRRLRPAMASILSPSACTSAASARTVSSEAI